MGPPRRTTEVVTSLEHEVVENTRSSVEDTIKSDGTSTNSSRSLVY